MLNARIRKVFAQKKVPIYSIGNPGDLTYDYTIIGSKTDDIKKILSNESNFSKILSSSKKTCDYNWRVSFRVKKWKIFN